MVTWMLIAAPANAGDRMCGNGLIDDPDYSLYVSAVAGMGFPLTIEPRTGFQVVLGGLGVIEAGGADRGWVMAIADLGDDTKGLETLVLKSKTLIDGLNTAGYTIRWDSALSPADQTGVDAELTDIDGLDTKNKYRAAGVSFLNLTDPDVGNPFLLFVTPVTNPGEIELLGFQLEQGGAVRGWLLRERRDLGVQGILFVDHWWYTDGYEFLAGPGDEVAMVPDGTWDSIRTSTNTSSWWSIPSIRSFTTSAASTRTFRSTTCDQARPRTLSPCFFTSRARACRLDRPSSRHASSCRPPWRSRQAWISSGASPAGSNVRSRCSSAFDVRSP